MIEQYLDEKTSRKQTMALFLFALLPLTNAIFRIIVAKTTYLKRGLMGSVKVIFNLDHSQVVLEGSEPDLSKILENVKNLAPMLKEIKILPRGTGEESSSSESTQSNPESYSMRGFARGFALNTASKQIAILAYYSKKIDKKDLFSVDEMDEWFSLCGFKKPKNMGVALVDAQRRNNFVKNIGKDKWTLSAGGENYYLESKEKKGGK